MFITKTSIKSKAIQTISLRKIYEFDFKNLDEKTELYIIKHKNKILKYLLLQELLPIEVNFLTQFPPIIPSILSETNHTF